MPTLPIPPWATEANYPAGGNPWNTQPTKVAPVGDYWLPNTKPPAQLFNWLFNAYAGALQALQSHALAATAVQWQPAIQQGIIGTMGADFGAGCFDPSKNQWVVTTLHQASHTWDAWVSGGLDGSAAAAWSQLGSVVTSGSAALCIDVCPDPVTPGDYWVAYAIGSWQLNIYKYAPFAWASANSRTAGAAMYGVSLAAFNGCVIFAVAVADGSQAFGSYNGSAWSYYATSMPAMPSGSSWLLKSNALPSATAGGTNMVLAIPEGAALGPATQVWKTTDGTTWAVSATLSGLPAGASVVGLAWGADALGPCWLCMVQTGANATTLLRSGDGAIWTVQRSVGPALNLSDLAANGMLFVATTQDVSSGGSSTSIFSIDGGITWYPTQEKLFGNEVSGFVGYVRPRIVSSGVGFLTWNNIWMRFSSNAGLPTISY